MSSSCRYCGLVFDDSMKEKLVLFFDMKQDIDDLGEIKSQLHNNLRKLSFKLNQYGDALDKEIQEEYKKRMQPPMKEPAKPEIIKEEPAPVQIPAPEQRKLDELEIVEPPAQSKTPILKVPEKIPAKPPVKTVTPEPPPVPVYFQKKKPAKDKAAFEVNFGQKWLLIIGILSVLFGIGYFLKYSFEKGWVNTTVRILMSYAFGVGLLVIGEVFRRNKEKYRNFGLFLMGGGIGVLYFSTFAAFQMYELIAQVPAFALMIMITAIACLLAIVNDTMWLAILGLIGGFLTPVLLSTGHDRQVALMTYITVLNLGVLGVAYYKRWSPLNYLGLIFTYIIYIGWFAEFYEIEKFWPTIIFLNIFYVIYCIAPFAYRIFRKEDQQYGGGLSVIVPNSFLAFGFSFYMIRDKFTVEYAGIISLFYALVFLSMATYLYMSGRKGENAFVVFIAKAIMFLILTVPIIFSGYWFTMFWAAEAFAIFWLGAKFKRKALVYTGWLLFIATVFKFIVYDYTVVFGFSAQGFAVEGGYLAHLGSRFATTLTILCLAYIMANQFRKILKSADSWLSIEGYGVQVGGFILLLFIALNVELVSFCSDYYIAGRWAMVTILWALFAAGLIYFKNELLNKGGLLIAAWLLLAVAAAKFVFFDYPGVFGFSLVDFAFELHYFDMFWSRFFTTLSVLGIVYFCARTLKYTADNTKGTKSMSGFKELYGIQLSGFISLLFLVLNIEVASLGANYFPTARFATISVLWGIFAAVLILRGIMKSSSAMRYVGIGLFLVTIIKVFLFDMAQVKTPYRIISFIIVGLLLMAVSYLYYRYRGKITEVLSGVDTKGDEVK